MPKLRCVHVEVNHPARATSKVVTIPRYEVPLYQQATTEKVIGTKDAGGAPSFVIHAIKDSEVTESTMVEIDSAADAEARLRAAYGNTAFDAAYPLGFKGEFAAIVKRDSVGAIVATNETVNEFEALPSLSPRAIEALARSGINSLASLVSATPELLQTALGIGLEAAEKLKADASAAFESGLIPAQAE